MGTMSAVITIVEGMTPVTNMDDSIHGTFWSSSPKMKHCPMSYQLLHFLRKGLQPRFHFHQKTKPTELLLLSCNKIEQHQGWL